MKTPDSTGAIIAAALALLLSAPPAFTQSSAPGSAAGLIAGIGDEIVEGSGSVECAVHDASSRRRAEDRALLDAVRRALAAFGEFEDPANPRDVVAAHRELRSWHEAGRCSSVVQAVVRAQQLRSVARSETRKTLRAAGRPVVAFALESYRILPNTAMTTRRSGGEVVDSLQQELVTRGFDLRRSHRARGRAFEKGGHEVLDVSAARREEIATAAVKDGVVFLVQGEIKITDEGRQPDGTYLAVVDGSLEAVDLRTDRIVGGFRDASVAKHVSASAASTKAVSAFARAAATELAPQMLDSWSNR